MLSVLPEVSVASARNTFQPEGSAARSMLTRYWSLLFGVLTTASGSSLTKNATERMPLGAVASAIMVTGVVRSMRDEVTVISRAGAELAACNGRSSYLHRPSVL